MTRVLKSLMAFVCLCAVMAEFVGSTPASAVEYVKVCSLYGLAYFYIPGTDICQNANQIPANQAALSSFASKAFQGVAISTAIVAPYMPSTANYAVSVHWGGYEGNSAVGVGGLARVGNSNFFLSGGVGAGFNGGTPTGERAGFMFAW